MAFPDDFDSNQIYEHRLDLDKISVFLEGDGNNPMFFSLSKLPEKLSFGKHYFHLSLIERPGQEYVLRAGSRVLFEFKSSNDVILRSNLVKLNQRNGIIVGYVEILKDPLRTRKEVHDGDGTFVVAASLEETKYAKKAIPNKFKNAINYRCTFPIQIHKNLKNAETPILTNSDHKLTTTLGEFSFAKASISARRNVTQGNTYGDSGTVAQSAAYGAGGETS
tara:strand:+ start:224 stop:886 length:663 start_codon:yes stop_codon:yes gene_type:complete